MNELIKQIAIEAGGGPSKWYNDPDVLEEFTRLIVIKCAELADDSDDTWTGAGPHAAATILEYFGVKNDQRT